MKTKLGFLILGLGLVFTLSCSKYPPSSDRLTEDLAVITQYDTKVNFNDYKTYSIPTSIWKVTDKDTIQLNNATVQALLSQIEKDMDSRGFAKVESPVKPDLAFNIMYFQNTTVYTYYYDWWGYYPYWGYYYPYYPTYYATYTTGLCSISLADYKNANQNNHELAVRWSAFIRGLLTGDHTEADVTNSVNQAFIQTPQLKTTPAN